jgi:thymidylate synthase
MSEVKMYDVYERQYLALLEQILETGLKRGDRTGTGTYSIFGPQLRYFANGPFPLLTSKKTWFKGVAHELLWFIQGSTNIKYLVDNGVHIWDDWADENGNLGPVYGKQWRDWHHVEVKKIDVGNPILDIKERHIDQLGNAIERLKTHPDCRRNIVSAWNAGEVDKMGLHPCHCFYQFYTRKIGDVRYLDIHMYQRSADMFLGVPFNMASYALLNCMVAQCVGMLPGEIVHTFGDAHIYLNHVDQVKEQISRKPQFESPVLALNENITNINDFKYEDIELIGYQSHDTIKAPIAV